MKEPIETERLLLREFIPTDDLGLFELESNPNVHVYVGKKPITHIDEGRAYIDFLHQQYKDFGIGRWAVILKDTNEFLGWSGIKFITNEINNHKGFYEIGYRFIEKHWGKGYATEAGKAFIDYAFNVMKVEALYAYADAGNENSRKILEKIGMQLVNSFEYEGDLQVWFELRNPNL